MVVFQIQFYGIDPNCIEIHCQNFGGNVWYRYWSWCVFSHSEILAKSRKLMCLMITSSINLLWLLHKKVFNLTTDFRFCFTVLCIFLLIILNASYSYALWFLPFPTSVSISFLKSFLYTPISFTFFPMSSFFLFEILSSNFVIPCLYSLFMSLLTLSFHFLFPNVLVFL